MKITLAVMLAAWVAVADSHGQAAPAGLTDFSVNGGFERVYPVDAVGLEQYGKIGLDSGGLLPEAWRVEERAGAFRLDETGDAFEGRRSFRAGAGGARLALGQFQVLTPAPVRFTLAVGGTGQVAVVLHEYFRAGMQTHPQFWTIPADPQRTGWQVVEKTFTPGLATRSFGISLIVGAGTALDAFQILAPPGTLADAPALEARAERDESTLLLLDLDGELPADCSLIGPTEWVEGRFGRAVRFGAGSALKAPIGNHVRREEGTIEFWMKFDFPDEKINSRRRVLSIGNNSGYHIGTDPYDRIAFSANQNWKGLGVALAGLRHAGRGAWRHVAATWSDDTWQLYLDGVLVSEACRLPPEVEPRINAPYWHALPGGFSGDLTIGSEDLVIDEVRISSRARYGRPPAVAPVVAAPAPVAAAEGAAATPLTPTVAPDTWQPTFRRGDYSFDAATNRVVALDPSRVRLKTYGELKSVVLPDREDLLAWPLAGVEPGAYFIGVVLSGPQYRHVFLNGRAIQFDAGGEAYMDARGMPLFREWVTGAAVPVAEGDSIHVNGSVEIVRLNLYRAAPPRGMVNVERASPMPDAYRFDAALAALPGNTLDGRYAVRNVHGRADTVTLKAQVVDYEQRVLWTREETFDLPPFGQRAFTVQTPGSGTWLYRLKLQATGADGLEQFWTVSCMADIAEGLRPRQWLSGAEWEVAAQSNNQRRLQYDDTRKPAVKNVVVPGPWPRDFAKTFEHVAWYRRDFALSPQAGQRYILRFEQVLVSGEVYVNGRKAGAHFGPYTPFEVEITPFVRLGTNVLEVGITDPVATLPDATLDKMPTGEAVSFWSLSNWLDAPRMGNVPKMGDVYLETRPAVHADDVRVICDYPARRVQARFRVSARGPARRVRVGHQVFYAGQPVLAIPERDVDLAADGAVELASEARWDNPVLWQMDAPRLCVLVTTVREDGRVVDEARTRFGFAHWRTDGHRLLLNDTPQKLSFGFQHCDGIDLNYSRGWASASVTAELDYARRFGGVNAYRADPNTRKLDYADELGFATRCQVTGVWNPTGSNILNDRYWLHAGRFGAGAARALGNHPSIAFWEASNEYACFAYYTDLPNGFARACERLWGVHQAILAERPDRLVESDADGDLNGPGRSVNLHYPLDSHVKDLFNGKSYYFPNSAFWHPLDRPPQPGELLPAGDYKLHLDIAGRRGKIKWGEKMVGTGETCWSAQYNGPFGYSTIAGDKAYEDDVGAHEAGWDEISRFAIGGQRDLEFGYTHFWTHYFSWAHRRVVPQICVVPLDYNTRFVGGQRVRRRFNLHNDTETTRELTVEWVWTAGAVEQVLAGETHSVGPAGLARLEFTLDIPRVAALTRGQLAWRVREKAVTHWTDPVPAAIWPASPTVRPAAGVYRFDPAGDLDPVCKTMGMELPVASGLPPAGATGLLVAPHALTNLAAVVSSDALRDRLRDGLKLVVLAQAALPGEWLPVTPEVDKTRRSGMVFTRDPHHPVLAGLASDDLRFWAGDHLVSTLDYIRPQRGNWRVIADSGSGTGLNRAPLLELYAGAGRVVLCQMPLVEKAAAEPAAAQLLANLVAYAGTTGTPAMAAAAVVARSGSALARAIDRLGIRAEVFEPETAPPAELPAVTLADLRLPLPAAWVEALQRRIATGGTVQLSGVRPETKAQAEAICGRALRVYPLRDPWQYYGPYYGGRAIKRRAGAPLLAGVSNHELCWVGLPSGGGAYFTTKAWIKVEILDFECRPADAGEEAFSLLYPHALLDFRVGEGRVVVNQLRWMDEVGDVQDRADCLAIALLTNLGVQLDPPAPRLVMPAGVRREILDLRPHVNLALTDELAGDGKGGWSDQGASFDMRNLPTGRLISDGVPFEILTGDKACLVLANNRRPMQPENPASLSIPVGRKLGGAWFAHTMAWAAGPGMDNYQFVMEYEDGRSDAVKIVTGQNAWDWAAPLPHAFRDSRRRAWTAFTTSSAGFPEVSVYGVEWVNPMPDLIVRSIRFESLDRDVLPILLGITLAIPAPAPAAAPAPVPEVETMTPAELERCQALRAAGQFDALITELQGIIAKAPAKVDGLRLLAFTLWKERRDFDGAEAHYLQALKRMGEHVDTLNKLGELNEERQAYAKALDYYQRSLKAEWNQPPTMDAVQRVQAAIGK